MPKKAATHSRADVRAMWKLMKDMGEEPVSVKYHPDGTFRIMTKKHAEIREKALGTLEANSWDEVLTHGEA